MLPFDQRLTTISLQFRRLGDSGLDVSEICLGTMMFGDRTDPAVAQHIIASAFEAGVNFINTANLRGGRVGNRFNYAGGALRDGPMRASRKKATDYLIF
jgi:aryl-alcohol dehydrogenase-like predicted oxidoreductase